MDYHLIENKNGEIVKVLTDITTALQLLGFYGEKYRLETQDGKTYQFAKNERVIICSQP